MESVDRFKAAMDSDRGALGPFMICTDPAMVEAAGHAGYDFVLLDMEHGTTTFQELPNLIRAANVTGVCPVVRVPRGSDIWIDQALDVGAGAVMIPQIDTAEQARAAVSAAKFSPVGTRGTCRFVRSAGFGAVPGSEYFSRAQDTVVILQAEGQKAIDNLDEILDVPGIDVVFVGPMTCPARSVMSVKSTSGGHRRDQADHRKGSCKGRKDRLLCRYGRGRQEVARHGRKVHRLRLRHVYLHAGCKG